MKTNDMGKFYFSAIPLLLGYSVKSYPYMYLHCFAVDMIKCFLCVIPGLSRGAGIETTEQRGRGHCYKVVHAY